MKKEALNNKLKNILNDNTSGSVELLTKLNDLLLLCYNDSEVVDKIIDASVHHFDDFQTINKYLEQVKLLNKTKNRDRLKSFLNEYPEEIKNQNEAIYNNANTILNGINSILTISNSKTVFEVLKRFSKINKKLKLFICESRPKNEGRILTKLFLKENVKCEFILDAMLPHFIAKVDAVIIGADKILKNGNVINKIGSLNAALLCQEYKKPFYVITSNDKFSTNNNFKLKQKDANEVWSNSNKNLKINNFYFEIIDKKLITKLITN